MKIGIDARTLLTKQYTGIARCVYEEISCFKNHHKDNEYYLFSPKRLELNEFKDNNWHIIDNPSRFHNSKLWSMFELPALIRENAIDVFWGTSYFLPRRNGGTKYIVSIYDLALFKFKKIGAIKNTIRVKTQTRSACRRADGIIAISESTKRDIHDILHIPENKITTSYIGGLPSQKHTNLDSISYHLPKGVDSDDDYFLFVSTIEPRKNLITIIQAFEKFKVQTALNTKLVLAGKRGWRCDGIYEAVANSPFNRDIIMTGFISQEEKIALLMNAKAFVYPSLYEGFGIPILEAFEYQLPVVTCKTSSMPEVAGDAAFYIEDPNDVEALCNAINKAFFIDENDRSILNENMKEQLRKFSWEKNADEIIQFMENLFAQ